MKRDWKKNYYQKIFYQEKLRLTRLDSLETGPGGGDLAGDLVLGATKGIFNGTELEGGRDTSLDRSRFVISLGGCGALDTPNEFTVPFDCVESGLRVRGLSKGRKTQVLTSQTHLFPFLGSRSECQSCTRNEE